MNQAFREQPGLPPDAPGEPVSAIMAADHSGPTLMRRRRFIGRRFELYNTRIRRAAAS